MELSIPAISAIVYKNYSIVDKFIVEYGDYTVTSARYMLSMSTSSNRWIAQKTYDRSVALSSGKFKPLIGKVVLKKFSWVSV